MTLDRAGITAIVLAGGQSSRFGAPKLAADLDGATLLEHALRAVAAVAGEVVLAGGADQPPAPAEPSRAAVPSIEGTRVRLVLDDAPFAGPLAALRGALRSVETELAIVVGGDMPGLVAAVLEAMLRRLADEPGVDAVVLHDGERRQVLPVALRVGAASAGAEEVLRSGDRSLVRFLDRLRCAELAASEWRALDPDGRTVLDVDTPADLDHLRGSEFH